MSDQSNAAITGGDRPRKIIVCHPDNVRRIQSGLVDGGITDVLVKGDPHGVVGLEESYVMDPPPDVLQFESGLFGIGGHIGQIRGGNDV